MENSKNKWRGLRAIVVVRQSVDKDSIEKKKKSEDGLTENESAASTAAQLDHIRKKLNEVGLRYVDKEVLDGVPGSAPAKLSAVAEKLFRRKKKSNDFDVIVYLVTDRASRSGGEHGFWLEHEAKRHGLRVFFAGEEEVTGPYSPVIRAVKYEAAKEFSVGNGRRTAQGQTWAQKEGFFRTAGQTPFGCDRVYCGSNDKPKFIMHNFVNGLQEQRDYKTGKVIGEYGTIGKKSKNRFRKQRNEYSLLYPGDREQRRVVRVIFYLRFKRGWRGCRIAGYLNRLGIRSPKGKEWSQRQVDIIYENEAYTGVTYNNQTYSGRFFRRDANMGFVALDRDEIDLVLKKTFAPKMRSMSDWERIDQPYMYDFLPRDVRDLAIEAQARMFHERSDPTRTPRKTTAHPASEYLFSGRLRAVQGNETLRGTLSGPKGSEVPYYRHPRSKRGRRKGSIYNNLIAAIPLHKAAVILLAEALADAPQLRQRLARHLQEQRAGALQEEPNVVELEAEREEVRQKIEVMVTTLKGAALADARPELQRLGDRRNAVEELLSAIRSTHHQDVRPIDDVVDEAIAVLSKGAEHLLKLPVQPLRDLVDLLIIDPMVDMETKVLEFKVALPTWALQRKKKTKKQRKSKERSDLEEPEALCLLSNSQSQVGDWTQTVWFVVRCEYEWRRGSHDHEPCYKCRRKAA